MRKKAKLGPFTQLVIKLDHDRAYREKYKKNPDRVLAEFEKSHDRIPASLKRLLDPRSRTKLSDDKINRAIDTENGALRVRHQPRKRGHGVGSGGPGVLGGPPPPPPNLTHVGLANQLQGNG